MIQFVCDSCADIKKPSEAWIVGLSAESVGVAAARREVTIQSAWDRPTAVQSFAVHFCSVECKDHYMAGRVSPEATADLAIVDALCPAPHQMWFDFACKHCSQQFSSSLREIVRGRGRLTCPNCDRTHEYNMADILESANEELPSTKKTAA